MDRKSVQPFLGRTFVNKVLNHLTGSDTTSMTLTPTLHLIGATGLSVNEDTTLAALAAVEATFSGYGAATPTLSGPVNPGPHTQGLIADALFVGNSTTTFTPDTITGYWVQSGTMLIEAESFPSGQGVPIGQNGDFLSLEVILPVHLIPVAESPL